MRRNYRRKASIIQYPLQEIQRSGQTLFMKEDNVDLDIWAEFPTLTIPATNAPQLNAPMSFGTEMNLIKQKGCQV
jgi:hypothetical protein